MVGGERTSEKEVGNGKLLSQEVISMAFSLRAWGRRRVVIGSAHPSPSPFASYIMGIYLRSHVAAYLLHHAIIIYLRF